MSTRFIVVLVLIAIAVGIAFGYIGIAAILDSPRTVLQVHGPQSADSQIASLEAQTAEMRRSEDRMLMVVMSMVGVAVGSLVGILAIAGFLFNRMHDRDIHNVKSAVTSDYNAKVNKLTEDESGQRRSLDDRLTAELRGVRESIFELHQIFASQGRYVSILQQQIYIQEAMHHASMKSFNQEVLSRLKILRTLDMGPVDSVSDYIMLQMLQLTMSDSTKSPHFSEPVLLEAKQTLEDLARKERWKEQEMLLAGIVGQVDDLLETRIGSQ